MEFKGIETFEKKDRFEGKVKVNDGRRQFLAWDGRRFHVAYFETENHRLPMREGGAAVNAVKWAELPDAPG